VLVFAALYLMLGPAIEPCFMLGLASTHCLCRGLAPTHCLFKGLSLIPCLEMGLVLPPYLMMGLALTHSCRIWCPVCISEKNVCIKITEGISVEQIMSAMMLMVS
jgi:hypothetical protein